MKKDTLAQKFSCEFCQIFKNAFFTEQLRTTTSGLMRWKQVVTSLVSILFNSPWLGNTVKINWIKFQTVDPKKCSILIFLGKGLGLVFSLLLCMIFQEKYLSWYTLLNNQISLPECLYFLRYWAICIL